jgi:hypothetical protein
MLSKIGFIYNKKRKKVYAISLSHLEVTGFTVTPALHPERQMKG